MVLGLGFRVLGFGVWGLGFRVLGSGFKDLGFKGLGFWGLRVRDLRRSSAECFDTL